MYGTVYVFDFCNRRIYAKEAGKDRNRISGIQGCRFSMATLERKFMMDAVDIK